MYSILHFGFPETKQLGGSLEANMSGTDPLVLNPQGPLHGLIVVDLRVYTGDGSVSHEVKTHYNLHIATIYNEIHGRVDELIILESALVLIHKLQA